ncbi:hypothetical protein [Halorubrum saccharovorum]|uniref:hypothetical protein n=1 Tax=Halorubrum saccharovorum TaxID=2248 RepID=UPI001F33B504|nr:hypothetical protein [Halorubrum saccharovorum]
MSCVNWSAPALVSIPPIPPTATTLTRRKTAITVIGRSVTNSSTRSTSRSAAVTVASGGRVGSRPLPEGAARVLVRM